VNITETLGAIAAQFPRAERSIETGEPGSSAHDVSSGGVKKAARDPEPALYLTSDAAIAAWRDQVLALLTAEKATGFTIIDGPYLDKRRITVADSNYTHRTAEDRYSVTARIGIIREAVPAVEPVVGTAAPGPLWAKPAKAAKKKAPA
jgi:hypothetical protein